MEVYNFLKKRYDAFYEQLERDCKEEGWDISFDEDKLFHDIEKINGHEGIGISQYPALCGLELELNDEGWRMMFEFGHVDRRDTPVYTADDYTADLKFKGIIYDPNNVEYPFAYEAEWFYSHAPGEWDEKWEDFNHPECLPNDVIKDFMDILHEKVEFGFYS